MIYRFLLPFLLLSSLYGSQSNSSIDDLIDTALKNHPSILMSKQVIAGSDAQIKSAKWGYFPTPSISFSQGEQGRRGTTFSLDQPLWTGGKLDSAVDIATSQKEESLYSLDETGYFLVDNILQTVKNYLTAQGNIKAIKEGKDQLEDLNAMLSRRIDAGVSAISDQELIKSRLTQVNSDLASAENIKEMAHAQLEIIVGQKVDDTITFDNSANLNQDGDVKQLEDEMLKTHPTIKKLAAQIVTARAEKDKAKAAIWPNVSLKAEHQDGSVYYNQSMTNNVIYIGLQASPGAGLSALSNIQVAEANILKAQFEKMTRERELSDTLLRTYNDYHSAKAQIGDMVQTIDASQKVFESYTRLFIAGKRQWLDLVNASRELTQDKIALSQMRATLGVSSYELALQRGKMNLTTGSEQ